MLLLVLFLPFVLAPIPPVLDYPNHLARAFVLGPGRHDPLLSRMYAPHWGVIPNLAVDIVLPPLACVLPLDVAGRLVLAASLLVPVCGALAYSHALFGRRSFWSLAVCLVAFNAVFLLGFMNFLFGLGLAFLVAAIWLRWRERYPLPTTLMAALGAVVVFFCHIIALFLLAALLGSNELTAQWSRMKGGRGFGAGQLIVRATYLSAVFTPPLILYACSPIAAANGPTRWRLLEKLLPTLPSVMNYNLGIDLATGMTLLVVVWFGIRNQWLRMPPSTAIALAMLLIAFLVLPFRVRGGAFFDTRFVIMAGYLLFAGLAETPALPRAVAATVAACLLAAFVLRTTLLSSIWLDAGDEVTQLRAAVQLVRPNARVLVAWVKPKDRPAYWAMTDYNLPALFLVQQRAFSPLLFTDPTQQPIAVLAPFREVAALDAEWGPPNCSVLDAEPPGPEALLRYPYLANWRSRFDYLLVLNPGDAARCIERLPARLTLLRQTRFAALYRIGRPDAGPGEHAVSAERRP